MLKYYRVFNLEQTEGIEAMESEEQELREFTPIERCEQIMQNMPNPPRVQYKKQAAWYRPSDDLINLPKPASFESAESFYAVRFHETAHACGQNTG